MSKFCYVRKPKEGNSRIHVVEFHDENGHFACIGRSVESYDAAIAAGKAALIGSRMTAAMFDSLFGNNKPYESTSFIDLDGGEPA